MNRGGGRPRSRAAAVLVVACALLGALAVTRAEPAPARELTVSMAISAKDAVETLGRQFVAAHPETVVRYNAGASGVLAAQIEAGAPVDVFVSAGPAPMDALEQRALVASDTRRPFARTVLAVVVPADAPAHVARAEDLADPRIARVAIGNPRTVPAGQYAEASLRALGVLDRVRPKLVYAENVRQVLQWVARGEVDAGWVYVTDVRAARDRVREAFRPATHTYPAITYAVAVVRHTREPALARAFVSLITSADAVAVLGRLGFLPPHAAR